MTKSKWYAPKTVQVGINLKMDNLFVSKNKHQFITPVEVQIINEKLVSEKDGLTVTNFDNILI